MTYLTIASFVAVIVAANALTATFGVVEFVGVAATAGTWAAGLSFVARDAIQEHAGHRWVFGAVAIGAALSALMSPGLALASATAFLLSELADWSVYTPLRKRGKVRAALASNVVGSVLDSLIFLTMAGFPLALLGTQVLVKVAASTLVVLGVRLALPRKSLHAASGVRHA